MAAFSALLFPGSGCSTMKVLGCSSLISITVDASNPNYSSVAGVLFDKNGSTLIKYPGAKVGTSYS
jgi:hypothetical protein